MEQIDIITEFKDKASLVSSIVYEVKTIQEALETAVSICLAKSPLNGLSSPEDETAGRDESSITAKTLSAPCLDSGPFNALKKLCLENDITIITDSLRNHGKGIDMGVTFADYAIADTGTLVLCSDSEEKRLSTMISEIHVALLPKSRIRSTALEMSQEIEALTSRPSSYTAFITGPSRTADIERVLAIGVHGPLELYIILLNDGDDIAIHGKTDSKEAEER